MKETQRGFISGILYIFLVILVVQIGRAGYLYYKGPTYAVQRYIDYIEKGYYEKAYKLLVPSSLDPKISKQQLVNYYTTIYNKNLIQIRCMQNVKLQDEVSGSCKVVYIYKNGNKEESIKLEKENGIWGIVSPFTSSELTIYAPASSELYLDGKTLQAKGKNCFKVDSLLPGRYMLEAKFPDTEYKDYYAVINVPEQKEVVIPYETVDIAVITAKGLEVSLGSLNQMATKTKVDFSDILPGDYILQIKSPYDVIMPIKEKVTIGLESKQLKYNNFRLSEKGQSLKEDFISNFYKVYLEEIKAGEAKKIAQYFKENQQKDALDSFNAWFIQDKCIEDAKIKVESELNNIGENGYLQGTLTEVIELTNQEQDETGEMIEQVYQIVLNWYTQIDITSENWQIAERDLQESIVAYKDLDGRWIQY